MTTSTTPKHTKKSLEQFPVDVKIVRGVRFETDSGDLMRIVVTSDAGTPRYSPYREYHYGNVAVPVEGVSSIVLRACTLEPTNQAIEEFAGGMSEPLDVPQIVSFCRGIQAPSAACCRLFKAIDPDDGTKRMGLLIEQDAECKLVRVTWYKTWEATAAFRSTPDRLEFEVVKNDQGAPSLDPSDIGGWTWHFSTCLGIGLSAQGIKA